MKKTILMGEFGITSGYKTIFYCRDNKYERLQDAFRYAETVEGISTSRERIKPVKNLVITVVRN